ncbi:Uncharacterised protein [uncultured archaeon]|nr:Uncharacterised protein [uncultured archaeon]
MKKIIKIHNGKILQLPARMYTKKDLDNMEVDYIEGAIFFNRSKPDGSFSEIPELVRQNMVILNYPDCSSIKFSEIKLKKIIDKQIELNSDWIILPYFRKENDFDVKTKIDSCEDLKLKRDFDKELILELSYKSDISPKELSDLSHNFDYLSIFYGVSFGGYPAFSKLVKRVITFKALTSKRVICNAVPLKFAGEHNKDVRFMPCFGLVGDIWVKNWRRGGGSEIIKVTDLSDLKTKDHIGWLQSGYNDDTTLPLINRTVSDLFRKENFLLRDEFEKNVSDAVLNKLSNLTPLNYEDYIYDNFYQQYCVPLIISYREKIILETFRENPIFKKFNKDELNLLEGAIRKKYNPFILYNLIISLQHKVEKEEQITIQELIVEANNFGIER